MAHAEFGILDISHNHKADNLPRSSFLANIAYLWFFILIKMQLLPKVQCCVLNWTHTVQRILTSCIDSGMNIQETVLLCSQRLWCLSLLCRYPIIISHMWGQYTYCICTTYIPVSSYVQEYQNMLQLSGSWHKLDSNTSVVSSSPSSPPSTKQDFDDIDSLKCWNNLVKNPATV